MQLGLDLGFGYVKAFADGRKVKFPSLVRKLEGGYSEIRKRAVRWGDSYYLVGEEASRHARGTPLSLLSVEDLIRYAPLFVARLKKEGIRPDRVATGLPPSYMKGEYVKEFKKTIAESFGLSEEAVGVFPQGSGILLDAVEDLGTVESVFVIDVGFNTLDVLHAVRPDAGGYEISYSRSIPGFGVMHAVKSLRDRLSADNPLLGTLSLRDLMRAFEEGRMLIHGKEIDLRDAVREISHEYAGELLGRLEEEAELLLRSGAVVLGGGGAYVLREGIEKIHDRVVVPPEPEFSQARGYYKALAWLSGEEEVA